MDYGFQYSVFLSDVIIGLGNEFVANSYEKYTKVPVAMLDLFYHQDEVDLTTKNYDNSKKHYLWFGSSGLLHKGLDLCLDFFIQNEEFILHICGASESETDFWRYYKPLIENKNNIINHGFINVRSEEFKKILKTTAYLLLPSVSEGGSPAVLTACGNGGLIPIIPKSCGLSLEDFGIVYSEGTDLGEILLNLKHENLKEKSIAIQKHIQSKYTLKRYRDNLKKIIIQFTE